jgi:hypothetical protein
LAGLIIEVQDHLRRTKIYYPVKMFPVRIGRGYSNDIILSDPHVCAEHLVIHEDDNGTWSAEDLDTKNGVHVLSENGKQKELKLMSGDMLVIGRTQLRFVSSDHPVEPSKRLRDKNSIVDAFRSVAIIWALLSVLILAVAIDSYLSASNEIHIEKLIADALPVVGAIFLWSALWALLAFIVRRRLFFKFMLMASSAYYIADIILSIVIYYLAYNLNSTLFVDVVSYVTAGVLLVLLLYVSMAKALSLSEKRRLFLANVFSWGLIAIIVFVVYANKPEFNNSPKYPAELKPPFAQFNPSIGLDEFMAETEVLMNDL